MTTVRMEHFRQLGYCAKGVRDGFARHRLDYPAFLKDGIDAGRLLSVTNNDAMVEKVVEVARGQR